MKSQPPDDRRSQTKTALLVALFFIIVCGMVFSWHTIMVYNAYLEHLGQ